MNKLPSNKQPYRSFDGRGIDVAIKRADDLDKLSCEHLSTKINPRVLDLGCGAGGHSVRMVKVGAAVTAVDSHDFSEEFKVHTQTENISEEQLKFICGDVTKLAELVPDESFTDAYIQRTLHYLTYEQAKKLLKFLHQITEDRLYISVTGIKSEVGVDYLGNGVPIKERFFALNHGRAETFSIYEPVCLYSESELVTLLEDSGWVIRKCWQSAFGNIKAICSH
ncbi:MAG: SAM-dependent methyltransferase [Candidatus Paceibacteria bacterium]|jgi:SAM-dependent methyltransferase